MTNRDEIPILKLGDLAALELTAQEKRWFLTTCQVLANDGLTRADAYEMLGKAIHVREYSRSASLREIAIALHEKSQSTGRALWKDDQIVRGMGIGLAMGLNPFDALMEAKSLWDNSKNPSETIAQMIHRLESVFRQDDGCNLRSTKIDPE